MAAPGRSKKAEPIVVKRRGHEEEFEAHNGAWKIAYADFTTMVMAFFMLLWLVNITTPEQREGIADYFSPITVSSSNSGADGQLAGKSVADGGTLTSSASSAWESIPTARVPALTQPGPAPVMNDAGEGDTFAEKPARAGSGSDLTLGEVPAGTVPAGPSMDPALREQLAQVAAEQSSFERIEAEVRATLAAASELKDLNENLVFDVTADGLRIQITDRPHFSMFEVGSIDLNARAASLLRVVAAALVPVPNRIAVAGHTDGRGFHPLARYSNWELSADRANAARRILTAGGIPPTRIARVEGLADTVHLFAEAPEDPRNRRISITVLRRVPLPTGNKGP